MIFYFVLWFDLIRQLNTVTWTMCKTWSNIILIELRNGHVDLIEVGVNSREDRRVLQYINSNAWGTHCQHALPLKEIILRSPSFFFFLFFCQRSSKSLIVSLCYRLHLCDYISWDKKKLSYISWLFWTCCEYGKFLRMRFIELRCSLPSVWFKRIWNWLSSLI